MAEDLVIDGCAFALTSERSQSDDENGTFAMFAFDDLQAGVPFQFIARGFSHEDWLIALLKALSEYYGIEPGHILREWAEYNALPGSDTYYLLIRFLDQAENG